MECLTCRSVRGERRISPGPTIFESTHWMVEHAYPCSMLGWLVIVLKRHAEALHDLSTEEFAELGILQKQAAKGLRNILDCEKEYLMCLAEGEGFKHIHAHIVAKPYDLPDELKATKIFAVIQVPESEAIPHDQIAHLCVELQPEFARAPGS